MNSEEPDRATLLLRIGQLEAELQQRDSALRELGEAKSALVLREEQFRMIAENVRELIFLRDPVRQRMLYVNPVFEEFWKLSAQELHRDAGAFMRAIVPDDRTRVEEVFRTRRDAYRVEYRIQVGDEPVRWISVRAFPVKDDEGNVRFLVGLGEDVTQRKGKEASREARLQQMFETAFEGILTLDAKGVVTSANPRMEQLLGYQRGEMVGLTAEAIHSARDAAALPSRLLRRARGVSEELELTYLHQNGGVIEARVAVSPLTENGVFVGGLAMVSDVTDRNRTEREVRASLAEKEVLLREVHHRVKNNLQIVSSLLSLQANTVSDVAARGALEESRERIQSIALAHELLYRSEDLAQVDFHAYLRELVNVAAKPFGLPEVSIDLEFEGGPVEFPLDLTVPCGLMVNELLTNALRHAFPGGRRGQVTIALRRKETGCELVVADDGVGVPAGAMDRKTLGLRLVHSLARQVGGELAVEVENGSRFRVTFPLKVAR